MYDTRESIVFSPLLPSISSSAFCFPFPPSFFFLSGLALALNEARIFANGLVAEAEAVVVAERGEVTCVGGVEFRSAGHKRWWKKKGAQGGGTYAWGFS